MSNAFTDTVPPVTTASISGTQKTGGGSWVTPVSVALSCSDGGGSGCSQTFWQLNGGSLQAYTTPIQIVTEGTHILRFNSKDVAGNTEPVRTRIIDIQYLTISEAKTYSNGAAVAVKDCIVSAHWPQDNQSALISVDRASGIVCDGVFSAVGNSVTVSGVLSVVGPERRLGQIALLTEAVSEPLQPLGMQVDDAGGQSFAVPYGPVWQSGESGDSGLNNVGQFVRMQGKVILPVSGTRLTLDGPNQDILLEARGIVNPDLAGNPLVEATGVVRLENVGLNTRAYLRLSDPVEVLDTTSGYHAYSNLPYVQGGSTSQSLDLYVPNGPGPYPLVVWIHGGGWQSGSKNFGPSSFQKRVLQKGFALASINYRLSAEAIWPAQIYDCKAAIRFLRSVAANYKLNPDKIGVWGSSAGGHLVTMLGVTGGVASMEDLSQGYSEFSSRVQCVVDWYGPSDILNMDVDAVGCGGQCHSCEGSAEAKLLGCPPPSCPQIANNASPVYYLTPDDAPFMIQHGTEDCTVAPFQSQRLFNGLQETGVSSTLEFLAGAGHGGPLFSADSNLSKVEQFLNTWLKN